jgi:S1-C subfamily serine protease
VRRAGNAVLLLVTAVVGAALALLGAAAFGKLGTTTVEEAASSPAVTVTQPTASTSQTAAKGLTNEQIYQRDAPGVVQITATTVQQQTDPFGLLPPTAQTEQALGSGFVLDKAGHIVTNEHVVAGAQKVQVSFSGQDAIPAKVVGKDASTDIAVLKVDARTRALTPLPLGDSDTVVVGDPVVAIGNPFGYDRTLTSGIVSATGREISSPNSSPIENAIQTDAAINHGNSGGPLIDQEGQVIGVTSQISTGNTGGQGNVGIGFAIPINLVRTVAAQLIKTGVVQHPFLGVVVAPVNAQLAKLFGLPTKHGLLVSTVEKGSAAAKAGLKAGTTSVIVQGTSYRLGGDIIVSVDGQQLSTFQQLRSAIDSHKPGDKLHLQVYRSGKQRSVTVTLGSK